MTVPYSSLYACVSTQFVLCLYNIKELSNIVHYYSIIDNNLIMHPWNKINYFLLIHDFSNVYYVILQQNPSTKEKHIDNA